MNGQFPLVVIAVVVLIVSYLAAQLLFDRLRLRFAFVSGAEYLVLGILLGPKVSGVLTVEILEALSPITSLALGWIGALLGSRIVLRYLVRIPAALFRVAFVESVALFAIMTVAMAYVLQWYFDERLVRVVIPAIALGAIATTSASGGVATIIAPGRIRDLVMRQIEIVSVMNGVIAVMMLGMLLALVHPPIDQFRRSLTATEWAVVGILIGTVGGTFFHMFLGLERKPDRLFVGLLGAVTLVSGAATYLRLSPLMSGMFFGIILMNTARTRQDIVAALERVERPLYFALLVCGGAEWSRGEIGWLVPIAIFLVLRGIVTLGSADIAARFNGLSSQLGRGWSLGLLGQGSLALAIALEYVFQDILQHSNFVLHCAVAALLVSDLRFASTSGRESPGGDEPETPVPA